MHKLEIKLKQHTPLIHFQHDQEGATLRASEVKPKLDRFIIDKMFHDNFEECKEFLVGYNPDPQKQEDSINTLRSKWDSGYRALNYKIRIEAIDQDKNVKLDVRTNNKGKYETYHKEISYNWKGEEQIKEKSFPFLISDMGGKDTEKELMNMCMYKETNLSITSTNEGLLRGIDHIIPNFFALHNFGQRQTKGFGSFTVQSIILDNHPERVIPDWNAYKQEYENGTWVLCFNLDKNDDSFSKQLKLFSVIDFYWRCLKSGINYTNRRIVGNDVQIKYPERYLKAYLWTYLNLPSQYKIPDNVYTWEKRKLKNAFPQLITSPPQRGFTDNPNQAVFARGLMGCPVNYEYRIPKVENGKDFKEKHTISIENYVSDPIDDKDRKDIIERIASPIIFKPYIEGIKVHLAILFDKDLINEIKNIPERKRNFKFTCEGESISIPISPESIDYKDLINKYNSFLISDRQYLNSLWGKQVQNSFTRQKEWVSGVTIKKNSEGKIERKCYGEDIKWRFIPRNFNWYNILQPQSSIKEDEENSGRNKRNEWMKYYVEIKQIRIQ